MSDKIGPDDKVFLAPIAELYDGKGWHGKGIPTVSFDKQTLAPILWKHELMPALCNGKETGQFYAVASDTGLPIGNAVGKRYCTPNNEELLDLFFEAIANSGYEVVSAGTVDNRVEFFVDAKAKTVQAGGRDISPYVGLNRLYGGLGRTVVSGHETVIQCGNTTALFRREAYENEDQDTSAAKNTLKIMDKLPDIVKAIQTRHTLFLDFMKSIEQGAKYKVNADNARLAYIGFIANGKALGNVVNGKVVNLRMVNRINRLLYGFKSSPGNNGENAVDWINGLTWVYTHESTANMEDLKGDELESAKIKQWYSSEFGTASEVKAEITARLFHRAEFNEVAFKELIALGKKSLKNTDKEVQANLD